MLKMFLVQYINTGVIIFLVNAQLGVTLAYFPIFAGQYQEFTVDWYRMIGSTIVRLRVNDLSLVLHDAYQHHHTSSRQWRELAL